MTGKAGRERMTKRGRDEEETFLRHEEKPAQDRERWEIIQRGGGGAGGGGRWLKCEREGERWSEREAAH